MNVKDAGNIYAKIKTNAEAFFLFYLNIKEINKTKP